MTSAQKLAESVEYVRWRRKRIEELQAKDNLTDEERHLLDVLTGEEYLHNRTVQIIMGIGRVW